MYCCFILLSSLVLAVVSTECGVKLLRQELSQLHGQTCMSCMSTPRNSQNVTLALRWHQINSVIETAQKLLCYSDGSRCQWLYGSMNWNVCVIAIGTHTYSYWGVSPRSLSLSLFLSLSPYLSLSPSFSGRVTSVCSVLPAPVW